MVISDGKRSLKMIYNVIITWAFDIIEEAIKRYKKNKKRKKKRAEEKERERLRKLTAARIKEAKDNFEMDLNNIPDDYTADELGISKETMEENPYD